MKNFIKIVTILSIILFSISCKKDEVPNSVSKADEANTFIMENVKLPAGSILIESSDISESSSISISSTGSATMQVVDNQRVNVQIPFNDPSGTVTHAGIAFGDPNGPMWVIPISGAQGVTAGILNFDMEMPANICDNLSEICHNIKCYEFAVSKDSNGNKFQISRSNINQLATACGQCDDASCTDLLGPNCGAVGADGNPRFNLTWQPQGIDLDLHVIDPSGEEIYFDNDFSISGGELDIDCTETCTDENITWINDGPTGSYSYFVRYYDGVGSANWTIRVFDDNRVVSSQSGTLSSEGADSNKYSFVK